MQSNLSCWMQFCRLRSWDSVTLWPCPCRNVSSGRRMGPVPHDNVLAHPGRSESFPSHTRCCSRVKGSCHSWRAVTWHTPVAAGERDPGIAGMGKWHWSLHCPFELSWCQGLWSVSGTEISLAVQLASRKCVVLTAWGRLCCFMHEGCSCQPDVLHKH